MNKDYVRSSAVAGHINGLIEEKRSLGYGYVFEEYVLNIFDNYCLENSLEDPAFSREFLREWLSVAGEESPSYHSQRVSFIRQLALYMNSLGIRAYVPVEKVKKESIVPRFLSSDERRSFFSSLDADEPRTSSTYAWRMWNEYRVIFRLLYSCGMRNSEACRLRPENVDLDRGMLTVYRSKGRKDRLVCLADDMAGLLTDYWKYMVDSLGYRPEWYFPSRDPAKPVHKATLDMRFNRAWRKTAYASESGRKPTVHSLRHSFVVDRMNEWMEKGLSFDQMMPYLSKYLGHSGIGESMYYYHLNEEANILIRKKDRTAGRVIPGVEKYGE